MYKEFMKINGLQTPAGPKKPDGSAYYEADMINANHIEQPDFFSFAEKIVEIKESDEDWNFIIYTDYDNDGFCAMMSLSRLVYDFNLVKEENFFVLNNNKITDGYNPKYEILEKKLTEIKEAGRREMSGTKTCVIITDTGITDVEETLKIKEWLGDDGVIAIMDHHSPTIENGAEVLPEPDYLIDLKASTNTSPIDREYSAAGLNFVFLMQVAKLLDKKEGNECKDHRRQAMKMVAWAAIGTKGDSVPLHYGNYWIVMRGITTINRKRPKDTKASTEIYTNESLIRRVLTKKPFGYNSEVMPKVVSTTLDFDLIPVLNAQMRLFGTMERLFDVVIPEVGVDETEHLVKSIQSSSTLKADNDLRKKLSKELRTGQEILATTDSAVITLGNTSKLPEDISASGLIGPLASTNNDAFGKDISFAGHVVDGGEAYGFSARASGMYSLVEFLNEEKDKFRHNNGVTGGGHAGAAGVHVKVEVFDEFVEDLKTYTDRKKAEAREEIISALEDIEELKDLDIRGSLDENFSTSKPLIEKYLPELLVKFNVIENQDFKDLYDVDFTSVLTDKGNIKPEMTVTGMGRELPIFKVDLPGMHISLNPKYTSKKLIKKSTGSGYGKKSEYYTVNEAIQLFGPDDAKYSELEESGVSEKVINEIKSLMTDDINNFSKIYSVFKDNHNKTISKILNDIQGSNRIKNYDDMTLLLLMTMFGTFYMSEQVPFSAVGQNVMLEFKAFESTILKHGGKFSGFINVEVIPQYNEGSKRVEFICNIQ